MYYFMMGMYDSITARNVGIGITIFVGGSLTTYVFSCFWEKHTSSSLNKDLIQQISDLKEEVVTLKVSLTAAVNEFQRELDGIHGAVTSKKTQLVTNRASVKFKTSWSEEDDFPSDEEFSVPPDHLDNEQGVLNTLDEICKRVDKLNEGSEEDKDAAMKLLQDNEDNFSQSWEYLWRLSRSHVGKYSSSEDRQERQLQATSALTCAQSASRLKEDSADVHKWYAISVGINTDFVGTKEKIESGYEFKKHIDRAIEIKPNEPTLYFLKGRWCWGMYMLTWVERKLAATLFATPPSATKEDALNAFLEAEELRPGFYKSNQLYLGKCYYEMSDYEVAKKWLLSAKDLPTKNKDDRDANTEIEQLLCKL